MKSKIWLCLSIVAALILGAGGVSAQTRASPLSSDQIRTQAGTIRQYKELLASPDASIRYAAVSEMLNTKDNGLRVLAFDMAFQSADSSIRALALKERVLSMGSLVIEPANENVASQLADKKLYRISIPIGKIDPIRAVVEVNSMKSALASSIEGSISVAGESVVIDVGTSTYGVFVVGRFKLSDDGRLIGGIQWTLPNINGKPASGAFPAFISVN